METTKLKDRLNGKIQARQTTSQEGSIITRPNTTALAPLDTGYVALNTNALDIIKGNLKNQRLSFQLFDVVKSPAGGATAFSVPGLAGDEIERELTGIVLDYTTPRAYWDTSDPVEGTPPVCYSRDSVMSYPDGKPCGRCVFNDYGSKNGETNAKACKESVSIFLLRRDNILPVIVRVPVSSKLTFLKYATRLVGNLTPIYGVETRITLEKATSKAGQPYAVYNFEALSLLSPEETANAKAFAQKFMEILNASDTEPDITEAA
jgi:hypothetical protein